MTVPEADPADVAEQIATAAPVEPAVTPQIPLEADEGDAVEQTVVVEEDDEYR